MCAKSSSSAHPRGFALLLKLAVYAHPLLCNAACDPLAVNPAPCTLPLFDADVSYRIDSHHELSAVAWGEHQGTPRLAAGDVHGNLYIWETGYFYLHPTKWNMKLGTIVESDADGADWEQQTAHSLVGVSENEIQHMEWSPDGTKLAIVSGTLRPKAQPLGQLSVFDWETTSLIAPTLLPAGCEQGGHHWHVISQGVPVTSGCYSGYSYRDKVQLGLANESRVFVKQIGDIARAVAWSPSGDKIVIGFGRNVDAGHYVILVNATTGEREIIAGKSPNDVHFSNTTYQPTVHGYGYTVYALAWSPDGNWIAIGTDLQLSTSKTSTDLFVGVLASCVLTGHPLFC